MSENIHAPEVDLKAGDRLHGFEIENITPLSSVQSTAVLARHPKSGARLLHLKADDPENLLSLAFRTPPPDDTGLPHILEHTVLCGSKKYPVKDPFVELLKTSLASFLNAMTYPDKTVYPCASMNENDFFNLAGVYCDAVFHPRLSEDHFKQEGHHREFAETGNIESDLIIKGIVYNEMKGAYSDLDGIIDRNLVSSICPDNAYGKDSGGDPEHIPELTYKQFVAFHQTYYHPSNALILLYGNIDTQKHLDFLNREYLDAFDAIEIDTGIARQPRWCSPVRDTIPYPVGPEEELSGKAAVVLTFLTNPVTNAIKTLSMNLLDYYLLGNAASPLRKALIDSKLGEELTDSGYANYQRETYFTVGLKGTEPEKAEAIKDLVLTTCKEMIEKGLDKNKVESAFHRLELSSREIGGQYPLRLMNRVYQNWLYDADPLHGLRLPEHLAELRQRYQAEPGFFEKQLEENLVKNAHYSLLTFSPDNQYNARRDAAFRQQMAAIKAGLSQEEKEQIDREAATLEAMQGRPNPPEALATLPRLHKSDVSPEPMVLPTTESTVAGQPFLRTDVPAGGISYLRLAFDLSGLSDELFDYLPLYTSALHKMGAGEKDYVAMAEREAAVCGGIHAAASASGHVENPNRVQPFMTVAMKALDSKLPEALTVLSDRLLNCDFTDTGRLKDVILQNRIHLHSHLVPGGSHYAGLYAARNLSRNASLQERLSGISQVRLYDRLCDSFEAELPVVVEKLEAIHKAILGWDRLTSSFVGGASAESNLVDWLEGLSPLLSADAPVPMSSDWTSTLNTLEGVALPADVAFAAKTFSTVGATHEDAPALLLLGLQLSYGYLWNEIRVKGGAYGARAGYNPANGSWSFTSYRDPRIHETLKAYGGAIDFVQSEMDLSEDAVEQAIIGTIKTLDQPIRPEGAANMALGRYLQGSTHAHRRLFRQRLLSLTAEDIRRSAALHLKPQYETGPVCIVSSREKLERANQQGPSQPIVIEEL